MGRLPTQHCVPSSASLPGGELSILRPKPRYNRAVIGTDSPIRDRENIGFGLDPFASHAGAEQDVVDAAVSVFLSVVVGPCDGHGIQAYIGRMGDIRVTFGGAGIGEHDTA